MSCTVCRNKVRRPLVDAALAGGLSGAAIARDMMSTGWPVSPDSINHHREHYQVPVPVGSHGRDLAIVVRDLTLEAVEDGRLSITDDKLWKNVGPGLKAQDTLDKRAAKANDRAAMIAVAQMLLGGGRDVPEDMLELEDGSTIEGEFQELDPES